MRCLYLGASKIILKRRSGFVSAGSNKTTHPISGKSPEENSIRLFRRLPSKSTRLGSGFVQLLPSLLRAKQTRGGRGPSFSPSQRYHIQYSPSTSQTLP